MANNNYTVQTGDSWAKIAGKIYGNQRMFKELMAANPNLKFLRPGQKLKLPKAKKNEDINISNAAAEALGMATTSQIADFYRNNPTAQKYGMTNMLRQNEVLTGQAQATWNAGPQTQPSPLAQQYIPQAVPPPQVIPGAGGPLYYGDATSQALINPRNPLRKRFAPFIDPKYREEPRNRVTRPAQGQATQQGPAYYGDQTSLGMVFPEQKLKRRFGTDTRTPADIGALMRDLRASRQNTTAQAQGFRTPEYSSMPAANTPPLFQLSPAPLGVGVTPTAEGLAAGAQAVGTAYNTLTGGLPPGATVSGQPPAGAQPTQTPPADPLQAAVQNIESGQGTPNDYAALSAVKMMSGQMTAQDWNYLSAVLSPDQLKEAQMDYNATFGLGAETTPGMTYNGIGVPEGIYGGVYVGPNHDPNKLRGYVNEKGTFVAANLAGSYFAPLGEKDLMGYRSSRNAGGVSSPEAMSGLTIGLFSWRI